MALFNTKIPEAKAEAVINHLDEGCGVRSTARLVQVCKEAVTRFVRMAGRHAERFQAQQVHDLTKASECDEQWSFVKKSRSPVGSTNRTRPATGGITPRWLL